MRYSISRLHWSAAPLALALFACGGPVEPPIPVAMAMVSGNNQEGKAGEPLNEPFVVRVTDAQGRGVEGVVVVWNVASGAGVLQFHGVDWGERLPSFTDPDGIAGVFLRPTALGVSTVVAEVEGLQGLPVTFTTDATVMLIRVGVLFDLSDFAVGSFFAGPDGSSQVTVPVGTTVEWVSPESSAHVTSTSAPPGGEHFDRILNPGERFQFVPGVAGRWEYVDQFSDGTGTLTAE